MRIFNLIGEGFHALRSLIITKESAMTDTSIINSAAQTSDVALPQFAVPDSNVPTDPQLQRLSSPSTVAPATSEETPGETHVAPDATAQHTPAQSGPDASAEVQPAAQTVATDQPTAVDTAAADQPAGAEASAEVPPAADTQSETQAPVADAAAGQASAQAVSDADRQPAVAADTASDASVASVTQSAADAVQSDVSAGVKDFSAAFEFVQQGIGHLGAAARNELIALAQKYL